MTQDRLHVGVLSFAHYHASFWSEVFTARGVLAGIWDDDAARGVDAATRFGTTFEPSLDALLEKRSAARCRPRVTVGAMNAA